VSPVSGAITYTHTGTNGDVFDSFAYTVEDDAGTVSAPATVEVALVPPAQVAITGPTPGETLIGTAPSLAYLVSGYAPFVGGARFRIDAGDWTTQTVLGGSFGWSGVAPGLHTLEVELLSPDLVPLAGAGAAASVSIATDLDADGDGAGDAADNCPYVANDQSDLGGVGASGPDGIGDACQCGDLDADGDADPGDAARLRDFLADPTGAALSPSEQARCSVIGGDVSCDVVDAAALARANASLAPGLAQTCAAALP
jgi:hypothetical protein